MGCSCGQCCCHTLGILATALGVVGLIGGLVLLSMYDNGSLYYWIAIGGLSGGAVLAICVLVYTCVTNRHGWKLYGCITIKSSAKKLTRTLNMMPSKEDVERSDLGHVNTIDDVDDDFDNNRNSKTSIGLDWDPETVLPD